MANNFKNGTFASSAERRREKDWMTKAVSVFSLIGWGFAIAMVMLFSEAGPEKENFITRILGVEVPHVWNRHLLRVSLILLTLSFVFCAVGFIFNLLRHNRETDRFNKPMIFLGIVSAVGIVLFLIKFSGDL
jgi:hypothetical protein